MSARPTQEQLDAEVDACLEQERPRFNAALAILHRETRRARAEEERWQAACLTTQRKMGEVRQAAFLELAEELAALEPAARDAAIRKIIDEHGDTP